MPTPQEILADPDFAGLPQGEKIKVFSKLFGAKGFDSLPDIEKVRVVSGASKGETTPTPAPTPAAAPAAPAARGALDEIGSFLTGARKTILPYEKLEDIIKGPAYAARHPIDAAGLFAGAIGQQAEARQKGTMEAARAAGKGDVLPLIKDFLYNVVGGVSGPGGPEMYKGAIEGGEPGVRAESLGGLAGMTAQALLPMAKLPKAAPAVQGPKTLAESLPEVPLLKSQASGSSTRGIVERALGSSLPGSKAFGETRGLQQKALIDGQADALVQAISKTKGTAEEIGTTAQTAIEQAKQNTLETVINPKYAEIDQMAKGGVKAPKSLNYLDYEQVRGKLERVFDKTGSPIYEEALDILEDAYRTAKKTGVNEKAIDETAFLDAVDRFEKKWIATDDVKNMSHATKAAETVSEVLLRTESPGPTGPVRVKTGPIKVFANKVRSEIKAITGGGKGKVGGLLPPEEFARMNKILDTIRRGPTEVDFSTMQRFRSELLAKSRALGDETSRAKGIVKRFSELADEAMEQAAPPQLKAAVRDANSAYKQFIDDFDRSVLTKMAKAAPEKVPTLLRNSSLEDIRTFRRTVSPEVFRDTKAHVLRDIIESSIDQRGAAPSAQGPLGLPGAVEPELFLNPNKLRNGLRKLGDPKLKEIYTSQELDGINKVLSTAERIGGSANSIGGSFIINGILASQLIRGGAELAMGGGIGGLMQAGGIYAGTRLLARVMARPAGASALTRLMKVINRNNSKLPLNKRFVTPPTDLRGLSVPVAQLSKIVREEAERMQAEE